MRVCASAQKRSKTYLRMTSLETESVHHKENKCDPMRIRLESAEHLRRELAETVHPCNFPEFAD